MDQDGENTKIDYQPYVMSVWPVLFAFVAISMMVLFLGRMGADFRHAGNHNPDAPALAGDQ
ncbi:hypothetical protein ACTJJ7_01040 [Phyllobacterium sp. 22229]|uniref:Uncharacterized protein n=1 Tax=Phyllobacterium myrsinacearum TaxID=28101 RepID=A0A2S9JYZ3_9HYPH|nr:hypothetical protein C5750_05560 [Phyllobacterium myrsinacearum]RZS89201.1 hypothetical protein EV217_1602 [Phyllobacterium myrsinacearum]